MQHDLLYLESVADLLSISEWGEFRVSSISLKKGKKQKTVAQFIPRRLKANFPVKLMLATAQRWQETDSDQTAVAPHTAKLASLRFLLRWQGERSQLLQILHRLVMLQRVLRWDHTKSATSYLYRKQLTLKSFVLLFILNKPQYLCTCENI